MHRRMPVPGSAREFPPATSAGRPVLRTAPQAQSRFASRSGTSAVPRSPHTLARAESPTLPRRRTPNMRVSRALLVALACLGLLAAAAAQLDGNAANATAAALPAVDDHADHDHADEHAHEAAAALNAAAPAPAAAADADHADHSHEHSEAEGHDHAAEANATTAAAEDAHDHSAEEGGSHSDHSGHSHGISVSAYCESGVGFIAAWLAWRGMLAQMPAHCALAATVFACLPCPAVQIRGWLELLAPRDLRESPGTLPHPQLTLSPSPSTLPPPQARRWRRASTPALPWSWRTTTWACTSAPCSSCWACRWRAHCCRCCSTSPPSPPSSSPASRWAPTLVRPGAGAGGGAGMRRGQAALNVPAHGEASWESGIALASPADCLPPFAHAAPTAAACRLSAGFGTILSTAFIHMLLPAAQNLSSPCLSEGWNEAYEAWAYMFVTVAIVFMQVRRVAGRVGAHEFSIAAGIDVAGYRLGSLAPLLTTPSLASPPPPLLVQLIDYLIEGAYQRYLEKRGSQPHSAACHEQAHGLDEHNHHAAVVGAIASMHTSKAHLGDVAKHPAEALKDPADTCQDPTHEHVHSHGHKHSHKHSHDEEAGLPDSTEEGGSEDASACAELGIAGRVRMGSLHVVCGACTEQSPLNCPPHPTHTRTPAPTQARARCTARAAPHSSTTSTICHACLASTSWRPASSSTAVSTGGAGSWAGAWAGVAAERSGKGQEHVSSALLVVQPAGC